MSYSVHLTIDVDTGGDTPHTFSLLDTCITYNLRAMMQQAGIDLRSLNEVTAGDAVGQLQAAVDDMKKNPDVYRALNPSNGWGDYEGCLEFFEDLLAMCEGHRRATIEVT